MAAGRESVRTQLAESVLDAAGSLLQLQEELDRISLRHCGSGASSESSTPSARRTSTRTKRQRRSTRKKDGKDGFPRRREESFSHDAVSVGSSESSGQPSSLSSSSRFDSAIGSLHSQTDDDSLTSQLFLPPATREGHAYPESRDREDNTPTLVAASPTPAPLTHSSRATVKEYLSPQLAMPTLITTEYVQHQELQAQSVAHTDRGWGADRVTVMGTQVQLRQKSKTTQTVQQRHQLTCNERKRWLESYEPANNCVTSSGTGRDMTPQDSGYSGAGELESEGSGSTVVAEETVASVAEEEDETREDEQQPEVDPDTATPPQSIYPVRPRVSMPQRYFTNQREAEGGRTQRRPPQRNASILQRLRRRRRGSFRRDARPQRARVPVQRSLSDRFVYHIKKRWESNPQEDFYPAISNPSLPRPIGRLLRTYAGRLHVIQLHKPADGRYGIYIKQGADGKIFISRFATANSEKFYAGLLSPGDEMVSVNKTKVRGMPLDSVYGMLSRLDSVVVAVVPVTAHRNW